MRLFKKWFPPQKKLAPAAPVFKNESVTTPPNLDPVPPYLPYKGPDKRLLAVLATGCVNFDQPQPQLTITKISQRNPEYLRVALLATSCARAFYPQQHFEIRAIHHLTEEESHAKKI